MSIQDISNVGANPLGPQQNGSVSDAGRVDGGEAAQQNGEAQKAREAGDRVEISDAAREAQAEHGGRRQDIELGRSALRELGASSERLNELRQRVQDGYYNKPDSIQEVAERMANDLNDV